MESSNAANTAISGAVVAFGIFLKEWLKDKKIGNFELRRLLPLLILLASEILNIAYGYTQGENIVISISNGVTSACMAAFGYDVVKSITSK